VPENAWHAPVSLFKIPHLRNQHFTGRERILQTIHSSLCNREETWVPTVFTLCGLSGVGKTPVAVEYGYEFQKFYAYTFWIRGGTIQSVRSDLVRITLSTLGADAIDKMVQENRGDVRTCRRNRNYHSALHLARQLYLKMAVVCRQCQWCA
jgi:hypothetical protein